MRLKNLLPAFMLAVGFTAAADGYTDGIEYYKAGQYDNARTILESTLNAPATNKALALYYLGQTALAQDDQAAALKYFEQGIAADATNPYNYVGVGAIELLKKQNKSAEENFKKALDFAKKDKNHEVTVDVARAYYNADPVAYAAQVEKYIQKARKDSKNQEAAIYILEGDMKFDAKDLGGAAGQYEQAITHEVDNPEGYVKYANAYMGVNPQYGVAKLEELVAKQPNSALAQRELAEKYFQTNQWTKASEQYGKYIQNPNHFPEDKARYSVLLYSSDDFGKSLQMAQEVLATDPTNFQALRMNFLDLAALDRNEEALAAAKKFFSTKLGKNQQFTSNDFITYATAYEKLGQDSLAILQYEKAVDVDPTKAANHKTLSAAYTKNGKFQLAAEAFDNYVKNSSSPSLTDYLQASGRWLNAANRATDEEIRELDAIKGLEAINMVIEKASTIEPEYYQRQGRLNYAKGHNHSTEDVLNSYAEVVALLDADPENANPANPKNKLGLYQESYLFMGNYYQEQEDQLRAEEGNKKEIADQVKDLMEKKNAMYKKSDDYKKIQNGEPVE